MVRFGAHVKVKDLKPLCKTYKLAVTGKKSALQQRLQAFSNDRARWIRYVLAYLFDLTCLHTSSVSCQEPAGPTKVARIHASHLQDAEKKSLVLKIPTTSLRMQAGKLYSRLQQRSETSFYGYVPVIQSLLYVV